jgi:hypothetical protein
MIELPDEEFNSMINKIEYAGNVARFHGQKNGKLVDVQQVISKTVSQDLRLHTGQDMPENSVRSFIACTYTGDKGIPFVDVVGYGGTRLLKLKESIGQTFEIDCPVAEAVPQTLEFTNEVQE